MSRSYAPSNYDDDFCLKPPLLLWIATLYLARALMLPVCAGLGHVAGVDERVLALMRDFWSADIVLPSAVAAPVLYCFFRRVASASDAVRWIWARGRALLAVAAAIDLVLPLASLPWNSGDRLPLAVVSVAVDSYLLLYILIARRVRDTFASFPPCPASLS